MTVIDAQRRSATPLIETEPLRRPDLSDTRRMTRRGWWLIVLNFLIPGSAQVLAGKRRLGRFGLAATLGAWFAVLILVGLALFARPALLWITIGGGLISTVVLTMVQVALLGYVVLWGVLTFDTLRLVRLVRVSSIGRFAIPVVALVLLGLAASTSVYASTVVASGRGAIAAVFGQSGPSLPPSNGYYNILLLGADSGDGRDSMRFDSISVVSVNAETGAMTITGIPRELSHAPFREGSPMLAEYPEGFQGRYSPSCGWEAWMNHIRNAVEVCREDGGAALYPEAASRGSEPGIEGTKDAVAGALGIEIPYYVFIDMYGFAALIDALGGVDITVIERLPKGGPPEGWSGSDVNEWAIGWIEPGQQVMSGDTAQWYARSRYTTNDWDRMLRQRELQAAILAQFTPDVVLTRFNEIAAAGTNLISTDLPQDKLPEFFDLMLKAREQPVTTVELTPESGVDQDAPDYAYIRSLVDAALHPPTPGAEPES